MNKVQLNYIYLLSMQKVLQTQEIKRYTTTQHTVYYTLFLCYDVLYVF